MPTEILTAKKPGGEKQVRQVSQAQKNSRKSLVENPKGRNVTTGKEKLTNNRQVVMNSSLT